MGFFPPTRAESVERYQWRKDRIEREYQRGLLTKSDYRDKITFVNREIEAARKGFIILPERK